MTETREDRALREAFARLRRIDAAGVPAVDAMLGARPAKARWRPWRVVPLAAAAVLALLMARGDPADRRFRRAVAVWADSPVGPAWRSPTDFLLDVPGREWMTTVPRIGEIGGWPGRGDGAAGRDSTGGDS